MISLSRFVSRGGKNWFSFSSSRTPFRLSTTTTTTISSSPSNPLLYHGLRLTRTIHDDASNKLPVSRNETSEYCAKAQQAAALMNHPPLMEVDNTTTTQSATTTTYTNLDAAMNRSTTAAVISNLPTTNMNPNVQLEPHHATSRQTMEMDALLFNQQRTHNPLQIRLCGEQGPAIMERAKHVDRELSSKQMSLTERHDFLDSVSMIHSAFIKIISTKFPRTRLDICGSSLSGLFSKDSDVDLSIHIPQLRRFPPKAGIEALYGIFTSKKFRNEFRGLAAVRFAKIPVLKGVFYIKEKNRWQPFDICTPNDISVANSKLLREYAMIDDKTTAVMSAVQVWAKEHTISSAALGYLSSYAWTNLAIFYLQQVGLLPNLQCPDLMKGLAIHYDSNNPLHCIDGLDTRFIPFDVLKSIGGWNRNEDLKEAPVSVLLHGFFHFYAYEFPIDDFAVSIRVGKVAHPKSMHEKAYPSFLCIEDPFLTLGTPQAHDLCRPVNALKNQERILRALVDGEAHFRQLLLGEDDY